MYKGNIEARSPNYCCRVTTITIIFSECVYGLSYIACKPRALYYVAIYGLSASTLFSHIIS